jgi:hypothetical protein
MPTALISDPLPLALRERGHWYNFKNGDKKHKESVIFYAKIGPV